jgi:hypothetical protein
MHARIHAFSMIVVATLAGIVPGRALAQEQAHEHDAAEHAHSHGGFPEFVDIFFTHHAYLERKLHPRFDALTAEHASQFSESVELAWRFNHWLGGEVEAQARQVRPDDDAVDGVSGIGDLEIAPMVALLQDPGRLLIVTARSGFVLPTGDADRGLGVDGWAWEPGLLVWKGFGAERRGALQAELGYERAFLRAGEDEQDLVYNLGMSWWLPSNFLPIVEINGRQRLGDAVAAPHDHEEEHDPEEAGHAALVPRPDRGLGLAHGGELIESDDRLLSGTVGFRYAFANGQQWGGGVQFPLSGDTDSYEWRLVVGGIIHLQ